MKEVLKHISPIKPADNKNSQVQPKVPVFEASLFKSFDQNPKSKNMPLSQKSRNGMMNQFSERQTTVSSTLNKGLTQQDSREKPLLHLKIKFSDNCFVSANVYKDDTAFTVADRALRHANYTFDDKEKKKLLA